MLKHDHNMQIVLCQSNEVAGSYHCELEGLKRCLKRVGKTVIGKIVTDRHRQVAKYLRENCKSIIHQYDIWHITKGLFISHYFSSISVGKFVIFTNVTTTNFSFQII